MTRIIIDVDLSDQEKRSLGQLLADALDEFVRARGPSPKAYVDRRYPGDAVYSGASRAEKEQEVARRRMLAEKLAGPAQIATIEEVPT